MLRTSNYDLCQYEGSDKTSYLINYNGDMLKIDTAIKAAKDAADAAQAKANTADGKADINESAISTLNTQINGASGLAADVATVQGSVNTINSLIGTGEPTTQDKTIIGAINELAAEMPSPTTQLPANAVSYVNTTSGLTADDAQEALDELAGEIGDLSSLDTTTKTSIVGAINELAQGGAGIGNTFGTQVNLASGHTTVGTLYEAPSNGYLLVACTGSANVTAFIASSDISDLTVVEKRVPVVATTNGQDIAVFVPKGCKLGTFADMSTLGVVTFTPLS